MSQIQAAQLLARGVQDTWLSGEPQVSFYRSNFKRHVPFALTIERFVVPQDGKIILNPKGDLLGYTYLTAHDPATGALVPNADWSNIVSTAELVIGNQTIATHDLTYINTIQRVLEADTYSKRSSVTAFQPLGFFFDRQALPLVALKYSDVRINITWASTAAVTQYLYKCWSHCVHLGEDERQFFATQHHQMIIPQMQRIIVQKDLPFHGPLKYIAAPCVNYVVDYYIIYDMSLPFTFTNMTATSSVGPTTITYGTSTPGYNTAYVMTLTGGIQYWTVSQTKIWNFTVAGAGSTAPNATDSIKTAYGVVMTDSYALTAGQIIAILVGQQGLVFPGSTSTSGSGGTFVCIYSGGTYTPLFVAGGGGGIGNQTGTNTDVNASTGTAGRTPPVPFGAVGGTNGNGATGPTSTASGGTAAGGFYTAGTKGTNAGTPANGFLQGGQGGFGGASGGANGGFGGGGGGGNQAGGGGGGYSGGAGGSRGGAGTGGGGGGSYSINGSVTGSATNSGMGYVIIS